MSDRNTNIDHVLKLAGAICDASDSAGDFDELDSIIIADEASRRYYWDYCWVHASLRAEARVERAIRKVRKPGDIDLASLTPWEAETLTHMPLPPSSTSHSRFPAFVSAGFQGFFGHVSSGWPMAYLLATVMTTIGLLMLAHTYVTPPGQVVNHAAVDTTPPTASSAGSSISNRATESPIVGQVTGLVDCTWEKSELSDQRAGNSGRRSELGGSNSPESQSNKRRPADSSHIAHLGDRFTLRSGLLEITYNTGARVILQGPGTYEVDSADGGYLAVGKLTARLEKRTGNATSVSPSIQQSLPSTPHSSLFTINTPTAVVTT